MIVEHDRVILTSALPEHGLEPGDVGVVVFVHEGAAAYEVEFVTLDGKTAAVVELRSDQVRSIGQHEIPHARLRAHA
jgi:hypothetical protein